MSRELLAAATPRPWLISDAEVDALERWATEPEPSEPPIEGTFHRYPCGCYGDSGPLLRECKAHQTPSPSTVLALIRRLRAAEALAKFTADNHDRLVRTFGEHPSRWLDDALAKWEALRDEH